MVHYSNYIRIALLVLTGSALSASLNKAPKEAYKMENSHGFDADETIVSKMLQLLQLRRDLHHLYKLSYQVKDPEGHILSRKEFGLGNEFLKGPMHYTTENGTEMVMRYVFHVEEHHLKSSPKKMEEGEKMEEREKTEKAKEPKKMAKREKTEKPMKMENPRRRSSAEGNETFKENFPKELHPLIKSVLRELQKLQSAFMNNNGHLYHRERVLPNVPVMRGDGRYDDLHTLGSEIVEESVQAPQRGSYDGDMNGPVTVYHQKPKARGYEQKWVKGQGLVADREYELPYDYRNGMRHRAAFADEDKKEPLYETQPAVKLYEMPRDMDGNYQIPEKSSGNNKQQKPR